MIDAVSLYQRLPPSLQTLACSVEGWRIERRRYSAEFRRLLAAAEGRAFAPPELVQEYRDARLRAFVRHAAETVPYYRRLFRELGVEPGDVRTLDDLGLLPVLTTADVQDLGSELVSPAVPERSRVPIRTSGTTGSPLRLWTTAAAVSEQWAVWWRCWRWHGIAQGTWCGYFGGRSPVPRGTRRPPYWRVNAPGRQIRFSPFHMSPDNLPLYLEELRRRRPPWLHGYSSALALLASYVVDTGFDLGYQVRWVSLGAENVLEPQKKLIRRAFGIEPLQHYGMSEAIANASQCEQGLLHVDEDFAGTELVADPASGGYRVVGTNFSNPAFPLLRYDVGDLVTRTANGCPCGRPGRTIASLDGRQMDYVVLRDGSRLNTLEWAFTGLNHVREAQIRQSRPGEIVVRVVRTPAYAAEDEAALRSSLTEIVGPDTDVEIEYVESIERTERGKFRFVVSELEGAQFERPRVAGA